MIRINLNLGILKYLALAVLSFLTSFPVFAAVGVFNIPRFVERNKYALGFEPEFTLESGESGIGANARFTHGLGSLAHGSLIIGTGNAIQEFRMGGNIVFDFFPDLEDQPGIGVALQTLYSRRHPSRQTHSLGVFDMTAIPYMAETFISKESEVTPFVALPFGWSFRDGPNVWLTTLAIGGIFKANESLRIILELGVAIQNTESYVSGGFVLYP